MSKREREREYRLQLRLTSMPSYSIQEKKMLFILSLQRHSTACLYSYSPNQGRNCQRAATLFARGAGHTLSALVISVAVEERRVALLGSEQTSAGVTMVVYLGSAREIAETICHHVCVLLGFVDSDYAWSAGTAESRSAGIR